MSDPVVSVVLTSYNQGQWLRQSIESVLAQTYRDWELILVDNGSTDDSPAIVEGYRENQRLTVIRYERNSPHTVISNDAIRRARGRYVSFLYSDDYYLPHKLARQVPVLDALPDRYGLIYSPGFRLLADDRLVPVPCARYDGDVLERLMRERELFMPIAPLVRREGLLRYPFDERLFMEGEGIFYKLALGYHFKPLAEPVGVMRDHASNMGKEIANNLHRNVLWYEGLFAHPDFPPALRRLAPRILGETYRSAGWQTIRRERHYSQGRAWLTEAVARYSPLRLDPRVRLGVAMAALPPRIADHCQDLLDRVRGAPPPPVRRAATPVEGRRAPDGPGREA